MKILLLEDHEDTIEMVTEVFAMYGIDVVSCSKIVKLDECLTDDISMVMMDLSLGSDPEAIIQSIKQKTQAPIYLVSGSSHIRHLAQTLPVAGYLEKPYELSELEELIEKVQSKS